MELRMRDAKLADRGTVYEFHRALYLEHRDRVMTPGLGILYAYRRFEEVLREDVESMLRNPGTLVVLAERDEAPVGYVTGYVEVDARRVLARRGIIGDWFVAPAARGAGVGRALCDALTARFREAGCTIVEMSTWPFNTSTRATIEGMGFSEIQITYRKSLLEEL